MPAGWCQVSSGESALSFLNLFAGMVLLVALGSALGVILILGAAPGYVARRRGHPWAEACLLYTSDAADE